MNVNPQIAILSGSKDSERLAAAAVELARSQDREAIAALGPYLGRAEFLDRLDPPEGPMTHLIAVFRALAEHPTEATGRLCEALHAEPEFVAVAARINLLLGALAAVRPLTPAAAEIFRATSAEGFAEVNAPLLLENESVPALQVFGEIVAGDRVEPYVKVDLVHRAVLPRRTKLPVVQICARLLQFELPAEVRAAIIETLYDYQSRSWFGPAMHPPKPPPWNTASTEALNLLIALAGRILSAAPEERLRAPVQSTLEELERIRSERR